MRIEHLFASSQVVSGSAGRAGRFMIRIGAQPRAPLFGGFLLAARDWPHVRTRVRLRTLRRSGDHSSVRAESVVAFALFGDGQPRKRSRTPTLEEHPARDFVPDPDRGRAPVPASRRTAAPPSVAGTVSFGSSCARDSRGRSCRADPRTVCEGAGGFRPSRRACDSARGQESRESAPLAYAAPSGGPPSALARRARG